MEWSVFKEMKNQAEYNEKLKLMEGINTEISDEGKNRRVSTITKNS